MKTQPAILFITAVLLLNPAFSVADPTGVNIEIRCPNPKNSSDLLTNFGDYIAGYGSLKIVGLNDTRIYFKSLYNAEIVSNELDGYLNAGVEYKSTSGTVSCAYRSLQGYPPFEIAYTLTNGRGGKAMQQDQEQIIVTIPVGLKAQ